MSEQGSEQNMTWVDTGAIRETVADVRKSLDAIESAHSELADCYKKMQNVWSGSAATEYAQAYTNMLARIMVADINYKRLTDTLETYADEYEREHGIAMSVAESIETPLWCEA